MASVCTDVKYFSLWVVHKLRLQVEVGRLSKNVHFYKEESVNEGGFYKVESVNEGG